MARLAPLEPEDMNAEQRAAYDDAAARGGRLGGPNGIHVRIPELFQINQEMSTYLRASSLPPRLRQLAVMVAVRHFRGAYAWGVQARASLAAGISEAVVNSINAGKAPELDDATDQMVYDVAVALSRHGALTDDLFATAEQALGFNQLLDLVATTGYYAAVAMWVNVFEVDVPGDIPIPMAADAGS
jgi:4-carboxymuconolactone decarboxylase